MGRASSVAVARVAVSRRRRARMPSGSVPARAGPCRGIGSLAGRCDGAGASSGSVARFGSVRCGAIAVGLLRSDRVRRVVSGSARVVGSANCPPRGRRVRC